MFDRVNVGVSDYAATLCLYQTAEKPAHVIGPDGHDIEVVCHAPAA